MTLKTGAAYYDDMIIVSTVHVLLGGGCDGLEWRMDVPQRRLCFLKEFEGINKKSIDRHIKFTVHPMHVILLQIDGTIFMKIIFFCICQDSILKKSFFLE